VDKKEIMPDADSDITIVYKRLQTTPPNNCIEIIQGEPGGALRFFRDALLIGSDPHCDLAVKDDPAVSMRHARIERIGSKFKLTHLAEHNTTYLKREKIKKRKIQNSAYIKSGDNIMIGNTLLQFTIGGKKVKQHIKKIKKTQKGVVSGRIKTVILILASILIFASLLKIYSSKPDPKIQKYIFINAVPYLQKTVEIYPRYQNAEALLKQCEIKLETEAKQYYEDGVIYEGIGKLNIAIHLWKKVLEVMPVQSNTYYQRAQAKLRDAND
jgi:hypothetical protein